MNEKPINDHFILALIAVICSCLTGFFSIPISIAALILSLRAQDLIHENRLDEAEKLAKWAGIFGWITILLLALPVLAVLLFGSAILAFFGALIAAA